MVAADAEGARKAAVAKFGGRVKELVQVRCHLSAVPGMIGTGVSGGAQTATAWNTACIVLQPATNEAAGSHPGNYCVLFSL